MTLVHINEKKDIFWDEEHNEEKKDLTKPKTNNSGDHDKKHMKIKFNSDDEFPLKKMPELHSITIRAVFHE